MRRAFQTSIIIVFLAASSLSISSAYAATNNYSQAKQYFQTGTTTNDPKLAKHYYQQAGILLYKDILAVGLTELLGSTALAFQKSGEPVAAAKLTAEMLQRNPFDPSAWELLKALRSLHEIPPPPAQQQALDYILMRTISTEQFWIALSALNLFFWSLWLLYIVGKKQAVSGLMKNTASLILIFCIIFVAGRSISEAPFDGVLLSPQTEIRSGDGWSYSVKKTIKNSTGLDFKIETQKQDWLKISLADGSDGWINRQDASVFEL